MEENRSIVETPSATTSSDNSSGPLVYILSAFTLFIVVFCLAFTVMFEGIAGRRLAYLLDTAMADPQTEDATAGLPESKGASPLPLDGTADEERQIRPVARAEAISFGLAAAHTDLDSSLPAFTYANADSEVSSYVRSLAQLDASCAHEVDMLLRSAARDDAHAPEKIAEAQARIDAYAAQAAALAMPKTQSDAVAEALAAASEDLAGRYRYMKSELELLLGDDDIDFNTLVETDRAIRESTDAAASSLEEALKLSKTR